MIGFSGSIHYYHLPLLKKNRSVRLCDKSAGCISYSHHIMMFIELSNKNDRPHSKDGNNARKETNYVFSFYHMFRRVCRVRLRPMLPVCSTFWFGLWLKYCYLNYPLYLSCVSLTCLDTSFKSAYILSGHSSFDLPFCLVSAKNSIALRYNVVFLLLIM